MVQKASALSVFGDCTAIGIDVSKASLEVVGLVGEDAWRYTLANTEAEIDVLAQTLSAGGYRHKLVCESTGHYHLLLELTMARYGLDLRVVNPLQSSKHQHARVRQTKTDAVDAQVLATMCLTERALPPTTRLQPAGALIRLKQGQLHSLDKQLQRLKQSLASYTETYQQLALDAGPAQQQLAAAVAELQAARRQLQRELEGLLAAAAQQPELTALRQFPGYSPLVAGLVGTVFDRQAPSYRSWVAYAGMDISVRESGTWRGRGKLTKRGNSYLRKRLYCAAWGAVMNYPEVRGYYDRLKAGGRKHVEALCIIARKLLRIGYVILVKGQSYDPNIAFATATT